MAVIKVACSKCGQRVSGDESFYGTTVQCPVCEADIRFPPAPEEPRHAAPTPLPGGTYPSHLAQGYFPHQEAHAPSPANELQGVPGESQPAHQPWSHQPAEQSSYSGYDQPVPIRPGGMPPREPAPAPPAPRARRRKPTGNGMPIFVLILGLLAIASAACIVGALPGILAIIMGHLTLIRIASQETELDEEVPGRVPTIIGLISGYLSLPVSLAGAWAIKNYLIPELYEQGLLGAWTMLQQTLMNA